jgi:pantetheine-phosphate adenylyltransferase
MSEREERIAIFPATFDPVTNGHLDLIRRALSLGLFDRLIVAVGVNPEKKALFSVEERVEMLREVTKDLENVEIESYTGLTAEYARRKGASVIVRGLRVFSDFEHEFQMAFMNRRLAGIDTIFLMSRLEYSYLNSTLVKQVAQMGGNLEGLVPPIVERRLREKFGYPPDHR